MRTIQLPIKISHTASEEKSNKEEAVLKIQKVIAKNLAILIKDYSAMKGYTLSGAQLSRETGVAQSTTQRILSGTSSLQSKTSSLKPFADFFGVTVDDIRNARETPRLGVGRTLSSDKRIEPGPVRSVHLYSISEIVIDDHYPFEVGRLPVVEGREMVFVGDDVEIGGDAYAVEVDSDSMEPTVAKGDRVIVDPGQKPKTGDTVLANIDGEGVLGKYRRLSQKNLDHFSVTPVNQTWVPFVVNSPDEGFIVGRAVLATRRL